MRTPIDSQGGPGSSVELVEPGRRRAAGDVPPAERRGPSDGGRRAACAAAPLGLPAARRRYARPLVCAGRSAAWRTDDRTVSRTDVCAGHCPPGGGTPQHNRTGAPPGLPVRSVRVNRHPSPTRDEAAPTQRPTQKEPAVMANKAIVGEKVGMTQVWDDDNRVVPVTVLRVAPAAASCRSRPPSATATAPCRSPSATKDARKLTKPEAGHFAKAGVDAGRRARRAAPRRRRPATRSARRSRSTCSPPASCVDVTAVSKGKGFAGVMKRHNFSGQKAQPRRPPRPPGARLHRRLRHAGPGVQGHPHGRPHGWREGHHAQPRGRRRPTPSATCCSSRAPCPGPKGGLVLVRDAVKADAEGRCVMATRRPCKTPAGAEAGSVDLDEAIFGIEPNVAGDAPGRHRPAGRPPVRHPEHQDPRRGARRRRQAVEAEGHRPGPPGLDPVAAVDAAAAWPSAPSPAATPSAPPRR